MTELSTPRGPGQMDGGIGRTAGAAVGGIGGQNGRAGRGAMHWQQTSRPTDISQRGRHSSAASIVTVKPDRRDPGTAQRPIRSASACLLMTLLAVPIGSCTRMADALRSMQAAECRSQHDGGAGSLIRSDYGPQPPTTILVMLRNIVWLMKSDTLLNQEHIDRDHLMALTGATKTLGGELFRGDEQISLKEFGGLPHPESPGGNGSYDIIIGVHRRDGPPGKFANISFRAMASIPELSFESIILTFGACYEPDVWPKTLHGRVWEKPTDPHGNSRIKYDFSSAGVTRFVSFGFRSDGTLMEAILAEGIPQ